MNNTAMDLLENYIDERIEQAKYNIYYIRQEVGDHFGKKNVSYFQELREVDVLIEIMKKIQDIKKDQDALQRTDKLINKLKDLDEFIENKY